MKKALFLLKINLLNCPGLLSIIFMLLQGG